MAAVVNSGECIACEACVNTCPVEAISIVNGAAFVDESECLSCGACVDECPVEAITLA